MDDDDLRAAYRLTRYGEALAILAGTPCNDGLSGAGEGYPRDGRRLARRWPWSGPAGRSAGKWTTSRASGRVSR